MNPRSFGIEAITDEDRAYRGYLAENHQTYRPYTKQNKASQTRYWNWRHDHPDHDEHR